MNHSRTQITTVLLSFILLIGWTLLGGPHTPLLTAAPTASSYLPLILHQTSIPVLPSPTWASPIRLSPDGKTLWIVNPDAGSISALDTQTLTKTAEIPTGIEPWSLAIASDSRTLYLTDRATGELIILDATTQTIQAALPVAPELGHIVLDTAGEYAYITSMSADSVAIVATESPHAITYIPVLPRPYALALAEPYLLITHLTALPRMGSPEISNKGRQGWLTILDTTTQQLVGEFPLPANDQGFPNFLTGISIAGNRAWLPHVRAMPELPLDLTTTVFAAVSSFDLTTLSEETAAYLPLNDQGVFGSPVNNPVAAVPSPDGQLLYIVLAGSNLIEVVDISQPYQPELVRFISTGNNPQGMAISTDGRYGYVMSYLSRTVTVLDLTLGQKIAEIPVTGETLPSDILQGKILFNNASDPRLSQGSWISCASCHFGGWPDGITWMFPDGPRQTPHLWNAGDTLPWHWSAALDEPQDVEETIEIIQHGLGLAAGAEPPLLGAPNAGRSADLDALGMFVTEGIRPPVVSQVATGDIVQGRQLFTIHGCTQCHGGLYWTSSSLPGLPGTLDPNGTGMVDEVLRDVGTLNPLDVRGHTGFDPPSLLGVGLTAPYFHDGSMPTLMALLQSGHPAPHEPSSLSLSEMEALVAFLQSLDGSTQLIEHAFEMTWQQCQPGFGTLVYRPCLRSP